MNKLLWSDVAEGTLYGCLSFAVIGLWCILVAPLCGLLWAMGGAGWFGWNGWRRIVMPMLMCTLFFIVHHYVLWPICSFFIQWGALSIGYSIPDVNEPKASPLGTFWYKISPENANLYTQLSWFSILALAITPMFIR
jgi:hypothetical protein